MPTAGPYGITQFDAAGVVSNIQAVQQNRIQMLVLQKQSEAADRAAQTQSSIQAAVSRYAKGGDQSSEGAPQEGAYATPQPQGASGAISAYAPDPLAPLPDATAPQDAPMKASPRGPSAGDREKLFGELIALDPETASKYMDAFAKMDKSQADQFSQRNTQIMQIMAGLSQLPADQRPAAIQQAAQELKSLGFNDEQIAGFDPSDQNLRSQIVKHMDAEKIAQFAKPNYMSVGGDVLDENALARGERDPVRYRSEFIATPEGLMRRPNAGVNGGAPRTFTDDDIIRMEGGQTGPGSSGGFP